MKERPILFSGAMIRAILAGQKTQTRRVVKPIPQMVTDKSIVPWEGDAAALMRLFDQAGRACPYGQLGDRLWVRESWRTDKTLDAKPPSSFKAWPIRYIADGETIGHGSFFGNTNGKTRPGIHMPRWASRILLEIVSVRVERLQDCSSKDAIAEGIHHYEHFWRDCDYPLPDIAYEPEKGWPTRYSCPVEAYRALWDSINGEGSWAANPWVWVVEFKRIEEQPR